MTSNLQQQVKKNTASIAKINNNVSKLETSFKNLHSVQTAMIKNQNKNTREILRLLKECIQKTYHHNPHCNLTKMGAKQKLVVENQMEAKTKHSK